LKEGNCEADVFVMLSPELITTEVRRRRVKARKTRPWWTMTAAEFFVVAKRRAERRKEKERLMEEAEMAQLQRVAAEYRALREAKGKERGQSSAYSREEKRFCAVDVKKMNRALSVGQGLRKVVPCKEVKRRERRGSFVAGY
jgi:hypothetical protein